MNPEVRAKWLDALYSGHYKQAHGSLEVIKPEEAGHCCLGVLCDVAIKNDVGIVRKPGTNRFNQEDVWYGDPAVEPDEIRYGHGHDTQPISISVLPERVVEWAGLHEPNPSFVLTEELLALIPDNLLDKNVYGGGVGMTLAELNDLGVPFEVIAKIIEAAL